MDKESDVISEMDTDTIEKDVKISYDGRQLMIRIPREITDFYKLKKGDAIKIVIRLSGDDKRSNREIPMEVSIVEGVAK
jgi:hypothetical protein